MREQVPPEVPPGARPERPAPLSMTGFGRGESDAGTLRFAVEVRCVNHRTLDVAVRVPREYVPFEERLRAMARGRVRRGRCEVTLLVSGDAVRGAQRLSVDMDLAIQYHKALQEISVRLGAPFQGDAHALIGMPGVCRVESAPRDLESDWAGVARASELAFGELEGARCSEGAALAADLEARLERLGRLGSAVAARVPHSVREQRRRLALRLASLLAEAGGVAETEDPRAEARAEVELAALAERADVSEELTRIASHREQFGAALRSPAAGRRCDFLAQELAREWATVAAKAADADIAGLAVEARVTVDQLREQAQNLE